ncbi:hypothetical protein U1701_16850 [Sphingomonas sp. PB2P19]|uniref:hypothetical protein n=1 Tax=Sphingomonas rhamnosi TaxID=3096156 RepID=UPI002FCB1E15
MKRIRVTFGATLAAMMLVQPAQACRVFISPEQRVKAVYAWRADLRVALVKITDAHHLSNPIIQKLHRLNAKYEAPWRVTASVIKMIVSDGSPELLAFNRGCGSAACDDGTAMPRRGDRWVVYYTSTSPIGTAQVLESYPLETASRVDPGLRENVR